MMVSLSMVDLTVERWDTRRVVTLAAATDLLKVGGKVVLTVDMKAELTADLKVERLVCVLVEKMAVHLAEK